jgi:probable rRNA maturation factor
MSIEIVNETQEKVELEKVRDMATHALGELKIHPDSELSIIFVDEIAMEKLHIEWMDEPGPTDVLSFPMDELRPGLPGVEPSPGLLGDVVVCPTVAQVQAEKAGHSTLDEILLLVTHGILHLLGYDHAEPDDEKEMFGLQKELLASFATAKQK